MKTNPDEQHLQIGFSFVENSLRTMTPGELFVYLVMRRYIWRSESCRGPFEKERSHFYSHGRLICKVTQEHIIEVTGLCKETVVNSIHALEKRGWLEKLGGRNGGLTYVLGVRAKVKGKWAGEVYFSEISSPEKQGKDIPLSEKPTTPLSEKPTTEVDPLSEKPTTYKDNRERNDLIEKVPKSAGLATPPLHSLDDLPREAAQPHKNGTATIPRSVAPLPEKAQSHCASVPVSRNGGSGMKLPSGGRDEGDRPLKKKKEKLGLFDSEKSVEEWTCRDAVGYFRRKYEEVWPAEVAPAWSVKGFTMVRDRLDALSEDKAGKETMRKAIDYIFAAWKTKLGDRLGLKVARPPLVLIESGSYLNSVIQEMQAGVKKKETDGYIGPSEVPRYKGWAGTPVTAADPMPRKTGG